MKKTNITNLIATLTVTAALAVLAGCATKHNYQQGAETGAGSITSRKGSRRRVARPRCS